MPPSRHLRSDTQEEKEKNQPTHARHAAETDGGGCPDCDERPSKVAETPNEEGVVAVPGLSLDTVGEPLLEAADDCGASGENGSIFGNQADAIRQCD